MVLRMGNPAVIRLALFSCVTIAVEASCRFGNTEYQPGQRWFPRLESQGTIFCVTCGCYAGGRMNCSSRACPVNCSVEANSECCKICSEQQQQSTIEKMAAAAPNSITAREGSCVHNRRTYKHGQSFPSNNTGMRLEGPNQCVQCKCQEGMVLCEVQTCPEITCREPMRTPDYCCSICPGLATNSDRPSSITFSDPTAPRERRDRDCISTGKYYLDGSSWHPVIGPFGPMDCVRCQCFAGTIECSRFKCPSKAELPCAKPVKQFGQCCATCPVPAALPVVRQQGDGEVGSLQCLPKASELVVFRAQGSGNLSEFIQYAFKGLTPAKCEVELHSWVIRQGSAETFQVQTITGSDFTQLKEKFKFVVLGATTTKHLVKFSRREKKLQKRCTMSCTSKVLRLEEAFNLVKVQFRKTCLSTEQQLSAP